MPNRKTKDLLARLQQLEASFLETEVLAPKLPGQAITVRIGQTICRLKAHPHYLSGWGVYKPRTFTSARFVREATPVERERYLELLPAVRMLVAGRDERGYLAVLAHGGDTRFQLATPARLQLAEGLELFDCIRARFDGQQFLYDDYDNGRNPQFAEQLRNALALEQIGVPVRPGLLPEEKWIYVEAFKAIQEAKHREAEAAERERRGRIEFRIADAIQHAGAVMRSYIERSDGYTVAYTVNGEQHTAFVDRNLRVQSAGICLSGRDRDFDLASLVSVVQEGQRRRLIHHVGLQEGHGDDDDLY